MNNKKTDPKDKPEIQYILASKEEVKKVLAKSNKRNKKLLSLLAKS